MEVLIPLLAFGAGLFGSRVIRRWNRAEDRRVKQMIRFDALMLDVASARQALLEEDARGSIERLIRESQER